MKPLQCPFLCKIITHTRDGTNHSLYLCIQGKVRLAEKAKLTLHCVNLYRKVFLQIFGAGTLLIVRDSARNSCFATHQLTDLGCLHQTGTNLGHSKAGGDFAQF